jgi:hypothetical protein
VIARNKEEGWDYKVAAQQLLGRLAAAFAPEGDANAGPVKADVSFRGPNIADKQVMRRK